MKSVKKDLPGNVAELGVYKGKFARYINRYFPGRKLYLFDTFAGFDKRDADREKTHKFSGVEQDFSDTSLEAVIKLNALPGKLHSGERIFPGVCQKLMIICICQPGHGFI